MRDGRCEVNEHPVARDVDVVGGNYAELLQRDGVLGIGDRAKQV